MKKLFKRKKKTSINPDFSNLSNSLNTHMNQYIKEVEKIDVKLTKQLNKFKELEEMYSVLQTELAAKEKELAAIKNRESQPIQKPNFAPPTSRPAQSVIRDPDNPKRETVGYLVKKTDPKTGQVTTGYKAGQGPESLQYDSTNPLERIGRTFFPGAYKEHDRRQKAKDLTNVKTRGYK